MFSFHAQGTYPRYNEFADKMPSEVVEQIEIDRLKDVASWEKGMEIDRFKRLNGLNKDLTAAFAKFGATCKSASIAFQVFVKSSSEYLSSIDNDNLSVGDRDFSLPLVVCSPVEIVKKEE